MKTAIRTMTMTAATALILGLPAPASAQANDPDGYGDGYQSGAYGRIRAADGGASIVRADGERDDPDGASVNAPLFPGDLLRTNQDQRVEVQLAGTSTVRIDRGGEIVFQSLPNPSAIFQDNTVLALNAGVIRVASHLGEKEEFRIDTRDASIYLLGDGEYRIETDERGGTRVSSFRGVAEVVGNDASVLVRGGQRTSVATGSAPDSPRAYSAFASDGFDRWCDARDDVYRGHDRNAANDEGDRSDLPEEVRPYYGELSNNGEFAEDPQYGTMWYPSGVASGWRPYNDGYWSYGPGGYFWVSYEPWGWAPYHYGNWQWTYRGWGWVPGPVFAGAWVSWSWGSLYVGWAPLDYWGRPGWVGGPYYGGYYDPACWTFVDYNHLPSTQVRRYAVPIGTVRDDLRHATVVSRAPSVDPRRIAESPAWRDRALRQVSDDHGARMRPIQSGQRPTQRLADVQNNLMRRGPQGSGKAALSKDAAKQPSLERRVNTPRPRRILEDQRTVVRPEGRPETRNDVRDLYQRMSRPKETRGPEEATPRRDVSSSRSQPRVDAPRSQPRVDAPRSQPRVDAPRSQPRVDAPRSQPRVDAPRSQPRVDAPRSQPRVDAPRSQPRVDAPRTQPRAEAPRGRSRAEAPRPEVRREPARQPDAPRAHSPQASAPRAQAPRQQAPRQQAPRQQAPKQQGSPKDKAKHGDKH